MIASLLAMRPCRALVAAALALAAAIPRARAHPGEHAEIERLEALLDERPDDARLWVRLGEVCLQSDHLALARFALNEAQDIDPGLADVSLLAGLTAEASGEPRLAERWLDAFLARAAREAARPRTTRSAQSAASEPPAGTPAEPPGTSAAGRATAHLARAGLGDARGDRPGARRDHDAAIAASPSVDAYLARGELDEAAGDLPAAAAGYAEGLERLGGAVVLAQASIRVSRAQGDFARALSLASALVERAGFPADALLERADLHEAAGDAASAAADRTRALALLDAALAGGGSVARRLAHARALLALGRRTEAIGELTAWVAREPHLGAASELRARARVSR